MQQITQKYKNSTNLCIENSEIFVEIPHALNSNNISILAAEKTHSQES